MNHPSEEDDEFDPMTEAYQSHQFNSYIKGPGSNLKPSMHTNKRRVEDGGVIKLHITNIPESMKEDGVKNIFSQIGEVHSVFVNKIVRDSSKSKWGFVEYKNFNEAKQAIAQIHNAGPHYLSVKYALTDAEKEEKRKAKECGYLSSDNNIIEPVAPTIPRGRGRPAGLQGPSPKSYKSTFQPPKSHYDEDLQPLSSYTAGRFNPTENMGSLADVANQSIRCTVNLDGSRMVAQSRSSPIFYRNSNELQMDKLKSEVNGRYHQILGSEPLKFGEDETTSLFPPLICLNCGGAARRRCYTCKAPYCSNKCSTDNWPTHKKSCSTDSYIDKGDSASHLTNGLTNGHATVNEKLSVDKKRGFSNRNAVAARQPFIKDRKAGSSNENASSPVNAAPPTKSAEQPQPKKLETSPSVVPAKEPVQNHLPPKEVAQEKPAQVNETEAQDRSNDQFISFSRAVKNEETPVDKAPSVVLPKCPIPTDSFTEVTVTLPVSDNTYWVTWSSELEQGEIMVNLTVHCNGNEAQMLGTPIARNKCAALYCGDWYRAKIMEVDPEIVVQLVDYGNKEILPLSDLRILPTSMTKSGPKATCVRFAEGTSAAKYSNLEIGHPLQIKPVAKEGDVWIVHIQGEKYETPAPQPKPANAALSALPSLMKKNLSISEGPARADSPRPTKTPQTPLLRTGPSTLIENPSSSASVTMAPIKSPEPVKPKSSEPASPKTPDSNVSESTTPSAKKSFFNKFKKPASLIPDDSRLPFDKFTLVTLTVAVSSSEYWVNVSGDLSNLYMMCSRLGLCSNQSVTPKLGELYVKMFSDVWCRAKVISTNPLKIFYLDFGNEELVDASDLRPIPVECYGVSPYAIKIKLADGTSRKYYNLDPEVSTTEISVKPACQLPDKTMLVMVEGEDYSNVAQNTSTVKHVIDEVTGNIKQVELLVNKVFNKDFIACSLILPGDSSLERLSSKIADLPLNPVKENETAGTSVVCEGTDGTRGRGYVLTASPEEVRVALTDLARVVIVSSLAATPPDLSSQPDFGVRLTLEGPARQFEKGDRLLAKIEDRHGDDLIVNVLNALETGDECRGCIEIWSPRVEEAGLPAVSIASGSAVTISAFSSPRTLFIQSDNIKDQERLSTLLQDTAAHTLNCKPLDRMPYTGEVVACRFAEDENFYRAQIINKKDEKYTVIFLDFGNKAEVMQSDLKPLDNSLKMVPCCAVKVGLKGIDTDTLNVEVSSFLNDLVTSNTVLFLDYSDGDLSQVKLSTRDGLDLNSKVMSLLDPNWKTLLETGKDPTGGKVFMSSDVKYVEWTAGSKIEVVLTSQRDGLFFGLNSADGSIEYICEKLTPSASEYCESFAPNYSYNPRFKELCLVKFTSDNLWYRAVCLKCNKTSSNVIFIDFGNDGEVSHTNIRPITPEFASPLTILKRIDIYGIPDNASNAMMEKVRALFPENHEDAYESIVVEDRLDGTVLLYFPHVARAAAKIGLPPIKYP